MRVVEGKTIHKEIGGRILFEIHGIHVEKRDRIGLIGGNGVGKSTLLKMIAGQDKLYQGHLKTQTDVLYIPQEKEELLPISGGQQVLHELKKGFAQEAELLLLDEPTANLDRENRQWLLHQLRRYRGAVIVVSHDREFLQQFASTIWILEDQTCRVYQGKYDEVLAQRQLEREQQFQDWQQYQKKKAQLQAVLEKRKEKAKKLTKKKKSVSSSDWKVNSRVGSYDGKSKSLAKSAIALQTRIEKMPTVQKPRKPAWVKMEAKGRLELTGHTLFRLEEGEVRRKDQYLFSHPLLSMKIGDKIALCGRNGLGKSSFLKAILQKRAIGYYSPQLEIAYFSQTLSTLQLHQTVLENASRFSLQDRTVVLNVLSMLGLRYDRSRQVVESLSGGEKMRLALAQILLSDANLLLLDEPTNFLDITCLEALEEFLSHYQGSVLVVSHDEDFLTKVCHRRWTIENAFLEEREISELE